MLSSYFSSEIDEENNITRRRVLDRPLELSHDHGRVLLLEPSIRQPPLHEARLDIRHQVVHDLLVPILASLTVTVDEVIVGWNLEAGGGGCCKGKKFS